MKRKKFSLLRAIFCFGGCGLFLYQTHRYCFDIKQYSFLFDSSFSEQTCADIKNYIEQNRSFKNTSLSSFNTRIKQEFPHIDSIITEQCAPGIAHVSVRSIRPQVRLNDSRILSCAGQPFLQELFAPRLVAALPKVLCAGLTDNNDVPVGLQRVGHCLVRSTLDRYDLVWRSDQVALFHDKKDPWFTIICSADSMPTNRLLLQCEQLKNQLIESKKIAKNRWVADVRFSNQIVIYSENRGAEYG